MEQFTNYMYKIEQDAKLAGLQASVDCIKELQKLSLQHLESYAEVCLKSKQSLIYK